MSLPRPDLHSSAIYRLTWISLTPFVWLDQGSNSRGSIPRSPKWVTDTLLIQPPYLVLTTYKIISGSGSVLMWDSVHSWQPFADQGANTMTWFTTQSHILMPNRKRKNSPCPLLVMLSARVGNDKCKFCYLLVWISGVLSHHFRQGEPASASTDMTIVSSWGSTKNP